MKILVGLLIFVLGLFLVTNRFIYQQKQGDGESVSPYEATLTGEYVCLPHKDTSGPQTLECAFGLILENGDYYALDFGENGDLSNFQAGKKATLTGHFTPVEVLSTDHWMKYNIEGIFSVKLVNENETEQLESQIKAAIIAKHGTGENLSISVSEISGNYAKGMANEAGMGGGMWFAKKVNEKWELVWDGNGIMTCQDMANYPDFPSSMIPTCYDEISQQMIER